MTCLGNNLSSIGILQIKVCLKIRPITPNSMVHFPSQNGNKWGIMTISILHHFTHTDTHTHTSKQYISVWVEACEIPYSNYVTISWINILQTISGFGSGYRARNPSKSHGAITIPSPSCLPSTHEVHSTELFRHPSLPFAHRAAGSGGLEERRGVGAAWPSADRSCPWTGFLKVPKWYNNGDVIYIYIFIYLFI